VRPLPVSAVGTGLPAGENLGARMIEGLLAEGRRITTIQPVGSLGNDKPITTIAEYWNSVDLKLQIFMKRMDPLVGESLRALINIDRAEPDPKLFQVPADYKIVDETGAFTLTAKSSKK
jgi:hypothetical protein